MIEGANMKDKAGPRSRREWFVGGLRYGVLAGRSLFSGAMLVRSAKAPGAPACGLATACRCCRVYASCSRPEAVRLKQQG